jgi:dihydroorotate dehydrogenase
MDAAVGRARAVVGTPFAIIASGGIDADVPAVRRAADLAQLWTGLIYDGPGLIGETARANRRRG